MRPVIVATEQAALCALQLANWSGLGATETLVGVPIRLDAWLACKCK